MKKILITREEFVNIMARMDRVNSVAKKIESLLGESGNDCLHDSKNAADIMLA